MHSLVKNNGAMAKNWNIIAFLSNLGLDITLTNLQRNKIKTHRKVTRTAFYFLEKCTYVLPPSQKTYFT